MTPTRLSNMPAWLNSAWLARYLERQLLPEEAAWFESYVLDKPDLLAMIEADNGLREALAADPASWRPASNEDSRSPNEDSGGARMRMHSPAWLALAASLVLGLGVGWLGQRALAPTGATETVIANPTRVVFDTLRGEQSIAQVERPGSVSPYILVEVSVPAGAEHVALYLGQQPAIGLSQSADGFASFLIARSALASSAAAAIHYELSGQEKVRDISLKQWQGAAK